MDVIVLAKEPVPGRVKTRLCPPCTPGEAARLAAAALADTLAAALASGADRVLLALDGRPGDWCPAGVDVVPQGTGPLGRRLATAWSATAGPAVQVGMDTPQVTAADLAGAMATLAGTPPGPAGPVDAVLGPAADGGWWAVGLWRPHPRAFAGVPMSRPDTGQRQLDRLAALGLRASLLPTRTDVDTWPDALAVAAAAPGTRFAAAVRDLTGTASGPASAGEPVAGASRPAGTRAVGTPRASTSDGPVAGGSRPAGTLPAGTRAAGTQAVGTPA